jgi:hypothetical protein
MGERTQNCSEVTTEGELNRHLHGQTVQKSIIRKNRQSNAKRDFSSHYEGKQTF